VGAGRWSVIAAADLCPVQLGRHRTRHGTKVGLAGTRDDDRLSSLCVHRRRNHCSTRPYPSSKLNLLAYIRYDTIQDAILTCARKPTLVSLIYRTEPTTKKCKTEKNKVTRSSAIAEGPCDASCQLKSWQLSRNSAETTYTTSPEEINHDAIESLPLSYRCHEQTDNGRVVDITCLPTSCCGEIF